MAVSTQVTGTSGGLLDPCEQRKHPGTGGTCLGQHPEQRGQVGGKGQLEGDWHTRHSCGTAVGHG